MKFCCAQFEGMCGFVGERGFGIVPYKDEGTQRFILQHRALDPQANIPVTNTPLSTIGEVHLLFCPWCGVRLSDFYKSHPPLDRSDLKLENLSN
jgi:hypothetical protein